MKAARAPGKVRRSKGGTAGEAHREGLGAEPRRATRREPREERAAARARPPSRAPDATGRREAASLPRASRSPSLQLGQQLCFALYSASRAVIRAYQPLLAPLGITYPQYLALLALWEQDALTVKALGERLALDSGTLTPLLQRLETRGLVRRRRADTDERKVEVRLTPAGRRLRLRARSVATAIACRAGFDLEDERARRRLARLHETLRAIEQNVEAPTRAESGRGSRAARGSSGA